MPDILQISIQLDALWSLNMKVNTMVTTFWSSSQPNPWYAAFSTTKQLNKYLNKFIEV